MRSSLALLAAITLVGSGLAPAAAQAAPPKPAAKQPAPPPLPDAQARMWLVAPSVEGPWLLRIDNDGAVGMRIPADARLVRIEIEPWDKKAKPFKCAVPDSMRPTAFPERRALLLAPGHSYVEQIDPRLFCFGKGAEALAGGAMVHARFGWDPPKKGVKKAPEPPFAAESTEAEPTVAPLRELRAPAIVLGHASIPSAPPPQQQQPDASAKPAEEPAKTNEPAQTNEPQPAKSNEPAKTNEPAPAPAEAAKKPDPTAVADERAGRLEISAPAYVDAASPRGVTITTTATNAGKRPLTVALRPWMLSFRIEGPYGKSGTCGGSDARGSLPRDAFQTLKPGAKSSLTVMLSEICPKDAFSRPGLYRVTPTLSAGETSPDIQAYTAEVSAPKPVLLRVASGPEPFYADGPKALPPPPPPQDDAEE